MATTCQTLRTSLPVRLIAALVVMALATALSASVLGLHTHVLSDGRIVVHWHPTDRTDTNKTHHRHSGHEYNVLANLGKLSPGRTPDVVSPQSYLVGCVGRLEIADLAPLSQIAVCSPDKRSPPAASFA